MKSEEPLKLSVLNTLKINEVSQLKGENLINMFKGGNYLRHKLGQSKPMTKGLKIDKRFSVSQKQLKRSQNDILSQEVAGLDHFRVPITRDKTKNMIQRIKLRRRQKHIEVMDRFKEDLDDYKENILNIYSSMVSDIEQVMYIKESSMEDYFKSCANDQYLLSKDKKFIHQIKEQVKNYQLECQQKLTAVEGDFMKIKSSRGIIIDKACKILKESLVEISFILEPKAQSIQNQEKKQMFKISKKYFDENHEKLEKISQLQKTRNQKIEEQAEKLIDKWKTIQQYEQIKTYKQDAESQKYRNPQKRVNLYENIKEIQIKNCSRKKKLLHDLIQENPDTISKVNINKWNDELKKINDQFDNEFDQNLQKLIKVQAELKEANKNRLLSCKQKLIYIQKYSQQEVEAIIKEQCEPLLERNLLGLDKEFQHSIKYVENLDERENQVLNRFIGFISRLATVNDEFVAKFTSLSQKYQIQKAKILDDDEQLLEKLNGELNDLKKQLRQSLHHIKLEEVKKKCFSNVDEIQAAYRNCHQKNKQLTDTRLPYLNSFFKEFEYKIGEVFELFDPSRKAELQEKNKKESEEEAMKKIQLENKKKAQEEQKLIEQTKKKGGKPPVIKPKDPKKVASETEERKKAILSQIGSKLIEQFQSKTSTKWLMFKNIQRICSEFYNIDSECKENLQGNQNNQLTQQNKKLDHVQKPLKDFQGKNIVTDEAFIRISYLVQEITILREKFFENIQIKRRRVLQEAQEGDKDYLQDSLIMLDRRLKEHYSLKGKIQTEIYVKRAGEITSHKKKYEKYVRIIKEKMDLQTQKFNNLLEQGLQLMREHHSSQKKLRENIPGGKNLSQLQGLQNRIRQNYNSFGSKMNDLNSELDKLCNTQIETLLQKNKTFIKESKLFSEGGEYSEEEIQWYKEMLEEITNQIKEQQKKRIEKMDQIKTHAEKKRKQLSEIFEKDYILAIEELAAKEGTGKKYGRPKRIAQEKIRFQMNKCEQAQINIDKVINQIRIIYEEVQKQEYNFEGFPPIYEWRKKLMSVSSCITRYGKHIQAFKSDLKLNPMIRVTYSKNQHNCNLTLSEQQEDKERIIQELSILGSLSEQKDEKIFIKYIEDIQKMIGEESRTIYVGDKAKYLTGTDKLPDFLRIYIANMKKSANDFKLNSIRELRQSCSQFAQLMGNISELIFSSLLNYFNKNQFQKKQQIVNEQKQVYANHKCQKQINLKKLRPNLSNPKCQEQLKLLDQSQKERTLQQAKTIQEMLVRFKDVHFSIGSNFLTNLLNNYTFLITFVDSLYLYEDFVKLPGDQTQDKKHLDIKRLMIMKQKGIKINTQSQRNIRKKWEGLNFQVFDIEERKYKYQNVTEAPKEKQKKGGKKDTKDQKKIVEEPPSVVSNLTKSIQTFKTWRHKSAVEARNSAYEDFKKNYHNYLNQITQIIKLRLHENDSFNIKWSQITKQLYL